MKPLVFRFNTKSLGAGAKSCDIDQAAEVNDVNCTSRITADSVGRGRTAAGGTSSVVRCSQHNINSSLSNLTVIGCKTDILRFARARVLKKTRDF